MNPKSSITLNSPLIAFLFVILTIFLSTGLILAADEGPAADPVTSLETIPVVQSSPRTRPPASAPESPQKDEEGEARNRSNFPEDYENYIPMPLPVDTGAKSKLPENRFVSYDLLKGEEIVSDITFTTDEQMMEVVGSADQSAGELSRSPLNFSSLNLVTDPRLFPYKRTVKIFFNQDGIGKVCSGALIDPLHVITAGHCLNEGNGGTWSTDVVIVPAYENGTRPFGDAIAVQLHAWTAWIDDGDFDHDIGIIALDRPVGALTGWHGYGYNNACSHFTGGTWQHDGYPAASPYDGQYMYEQSGFFDACSSTLDAYQVTYNSLSYGGQSGSGAYRDYIVQAALSNGTSSTTSDARITESKFFLIRDTIIANNTPATYDLMPLNVQTSPASIVAGNQLSSMSFIVHNYSSASYDGTVDFTVYLSTNDNISTSDTPLMAGYFDYNFGPKDTVLVNVSSPPVIPAGTTIGDYYIGVILDNVDANTGNNDSDGQDASAITIGCTDPIVNGGFEETTGWVTKATEYTAGYAEDPEPVRSGQWSMRTGIVNPVHNKYSYSSAIQAVNIPSNAEYMELNFWIYPQTGEDESIPLYLPRDPLNIRETDAINASDWQFVFILNEYGYELERLLYRRQDADVWQFFSFDLSHHKNEGTIQLYFDTFNNGYDGITSMHIDDVSLQVCDEPPPPEVDGTIAGTVVLQGRSDYSGAQVCAEDGVATTCVQTDAAGAYSLDVPAGDYEVTVTKELYLDAEKLSVPVTASTVTTLDPVKLLGGDTNDDCDVNILDLSLIGGRFNLTCSDTNWDARADINADCTVNILDLSLVGGNFGNSCPVPWN